MEVPPLLFDIVSAFSVFKGRFTKTITTIAIARQIFFLIVSPVNTFISRTFQIDTSVKIALSHTAYHLFHLENYERSAYISPHTHYVDVSQSNIRHDERAVFFDKWQNRYIPGLSEGFLRQNNQETLLHLRKQTGFFVIIPS